MSDPRLDAAVSKAESLLSTRFGLTSKVAAILEAADAADPMSEYTVTLHLEVVPRRGWRRRPTITKQITRPLLNVTVDRGNTLDAADLAIEIEDDGELTKMEVHAPEGLLLATWKLTPPKLVYPGVVQVKWSQNGIIYMGPEGLPILPPSGVGVS